MWNKTQVQNITVLSDNWFQSTQNREDTEFEATYLSALWVLLIHALGSYICYITGKLSVIRCIQTYLQQNPKRLQHFHFHPGCHLPKNCTWAQSATFLIFFQKLLVQNLTANPVISEAFPSVFLSLSRQIKGHYIKLTPRALLVPHPFKKLQQRHATTPSLGATFSSVGFSQCFRLSYCLKLQGKFNHGRWLQYFGGK